MTGGMMDKKRQEELCIKGNQADKNLYDGRAREALKMYNEISKELEKTGHVDSYFTAKITLGVLRCYVKLGDFKSAFDVWNATQEDSVHGIGIYSLESAQTTVRDMIVYDMLCGFLHTRTDAEHNEAAAAVNQYLSRVCEHALEDGDRATMKQAISNWKQHLRDVFQSSIPFEFAEPLIRFEKTLGETVKPLPLEFPTSASWEKPSDFREMSRVSNLKEMKNLKTKKTSGGGGGKSRAS
jgi:pentatricopeptide repeat protein